MIISLNGKLTQGTLALADGDGGHGEAVTVRENALRQSGEGILVAVLILLQPTGLHTHFYSKRKQTHAERRLLGLRLTARLLGLPGMFYIL